MLMGLPPAKLPEGLSLKDYPAIEAASMTARGPYGKADVEALTKLFSWIPANGYEPAGQPRIVYFHQPELTVPGDMISEV